MLYNSFPEAEATKAVTQDITSIYWSDADSGRINGDIKFRLNNVDAPETGGVGAAIGGAACELERERGFASKDWIVTFIALMTEHSFKPIANKR